MKWIFLLIPSLFFGQFNPVFFNSGKIGNMYSNLVAYYKLDNTLVDATGAATTGGFLNGAGFSTGKINDGILFNGATQRMDIPDYPAFSFTTGSNDLTFTISFWVYYTGFSSGQNRLFNKRSLLGGATSEYVIQATASNITFIKGSGGNFTNNKQTVYTFPWVLNTWYHVVVTSNAVSEKIYINGVTASDATVTTGTYTTMQDTSAPLMVGSMDAIANSEHQGKIDEIAIWRGKELNAIQVNYLYNAGLGKQYPF